MSQTYAETGAPVGRLDLTVDARWRQVRVHAAYGGWALRGGVVGPDAVWVRAPEGDPDEGLETSERAAGFTGRSPAFLVATARLLGLELSDRRRIHLIGITEPACLPLAVDQGWALVDVSRHETETGPLRVERYEVADLATAERHVAHLAGDVVLDAPGIELVELESPPNQP